MTVDIKSELIMGVSASEETERKLRAVHGVGSRQINFMVMETTIGRMKYYCCWSGGSLVDGEVHLSMVGQGAMEALNALPFGDQGTICFQELCIGRTPLRKKIIKNLIEKPAGSKVCFFGDMGGELDGKMMDAFNMQKFGVNR
jgi:hypothetical protein